jgi:hypothetical protein
MSIPVSREDAIKAGADAAWEAEGYASDGVKDLVKFRAAIADAVMPAKVINQGDLNANAVSRGTILSQVFPNLHDDDDDDISVSVRNKISGQIWFELRIDGVIQEKVESVHGNGYVLIRVKIGTNSTDVVDGVCVTDNQKLIDKYMVKPMADSTQRQITRAQHMYALLIQRQPENGKRWLSSYDRTLKALVSASHEQLMLALEAATSEPSSEDDDSEQAA